jgi:hypothetical protein
MPDELTTNSPIIAAYRVATPGSAARAQRANQVFPSGITHDSRYIEPYGLYIEPYGLYIERAQGARAHRHLADPLRPAAIAARGPEGPTDTLPGWCTNCGWE